jgi:uncharacterized protein (DUF952 family)
MSGVIYKICPAEIWKKAVRAGVFKGAGIDLTDGYIHFSTADQVASTAHLHFNGVEGLVLVLIGTEGLNVVWEESRGGQLFPHLYEDLDMRFVQTVTPMMLNDRGQHIFPQDITSQ